MKYTKVVPVVVALGLASGVASAATQTPDVDSLFQITEVSSQGLLTANKDADHKCGAGACGSDKKDAHHDHKDGDKHDGHHDDKDHHDNHDGDKEHHDKEHHDEKHGH